MIIYLDFVNAEEFTVTYFGMSLPPTVSAPDFSFRMTRAQRLQSWRAIFLRCVIRNAKVSLGLLIIQSEREKQHKAFVSGSISQENFKLEKLKQ